MRTSIDVAPGADGMRFVVPVRTTAARPNPKYFSATKRRTGATWLNVVSDKVMGLGGLVVPGTRRVGGGSFTHRPPQIRT